MSDGDGTKQGAPANSGNEGGVTATLFTQDQVNSIAAREKRGALGAFFKELGFDEAPDAETLKQTFDAAKEFQKVQDGQKGDLERLNGELSSEKEKSARIPTLESTVLRQQIAGSEGLPVRFWKFVEGKTEDEIRESIQGLKDDLDLGTGGDDSEQGGGQKQRPPSGTGARPPAPNQQQGRTNGGGAPGKTLSAGREAYDTKHKRA